MEAVAYSTFRGNLRHYLDKTRDDAEAILVTSKDPSSNVVVLNVRDYENLVENNYIRSNSYLYDKLLRGKKAVATGAFIERELIDETDSAHA